MSLSTRAIALQGVGFERRQVATQGLLQTAVTTPDDNPDGFYRRAAAAIMPNRTTGHHNDVFVRIARRRAMKP